MSHWKGSVFIGPNQFTAFECLSSWLNLALWTQTVTLQKWISLKHVGLWSSVSCHLLLGAMRAQQRCWSQPGWVEEPLMLCSTPGADMLRVQTVLGGSSGDVDGVGGSHPLLFSKERHRQFIIEFCCSL